MSTSPASDPNTIDLTSSEYYTPPLHTLADLLETVPSVIKRRQRRPPKVKAATNTHESVTSNDTEPSITNEAPSISTNKTELSTTNNAEPVMKRKRGRPPKNPKNVAEPPPAIEKTAATATELHTETMATPIKNQNPAIAISQLLFDGTEDRYNIVPQGMMNDVLELVSVPDAEGQSLGGGSSGSGERGESTAGAAEMAATTASNSGNTGAVPKKKRGRPPKMHGDGVAVSAKKTKISNGNSHSASGTEMTTNTAGGLRVESTAGAAEVAATTASNSGEAGAETKKKRGRPPKTQFDGVAVPAKKKKVLNDGDDGKPPKTWTEKEIKLIQDLVKEHGTKWDVVHTEFNKVMGPTKNQIS
ncbi:hypothetical protein HDV00_007759 [Rhizophlyctis rosea]|nr:hypothetical protein HDV00_007759 [Rhizophlyctis rosea]